MSTNNHHHNFPDDRKLKLIPAKLFHKQGELTFIQYKITIIMKSFATRKIIEKFVK